MGLFSFPTGAKDGGPVVADSPVEPPPAPAVEPAAVPAAAAVTASDSRTPAPAPAEGWDIDTGALTAPAAPKANSPVVGPVDAALTAAMQAPIIDVIKTVYDPEIPVDIYELGLIYDIIVDADRKVLINMTLTSPACPSAQQLPSEVRYKVKAIPEVSDAVVEIVWEPPWDKDRMSEAAKLQLGFL
jgi:FeS assembly SUF system protein